MKFTKRSGSFGAIAVLLAATAISAPFATAAPTAPVGNPVGSPGCGQAPTSSPGQTVDQTVTSGNDLRHYRLHLPADYQPEQALPVVLAFHGRKGDSSDIEAFSGIDALETIAVYPLGMLGEDDETAWQSAPYAAAVDDVQFVRDLLDQVQNTLCVDTDRIYATGKSNGGGFTALLACQLPERIAAFATVAGAFYPGTTTGCASSPPVPYLDFHGTADTIINYDGGVSHGEPLPALTDWMANWAQHNGCTDTASTGIGTDVVQFSWSGCAPGAPVVHYQIKDAGHTWPGELVDSGPGSATQTISATKIMWTFFADHPLSAR